jgi:anaerobic selenocysteine-containing dehydrogenase
MLVDVEGERLVGVRGDPDNPDSRGFLCIRGQASREVIGNPRRLLHPLVRERRGQEFRRASWDEALDRIASAMRAAGREAVGTWTGHGLFTNNYGTRVASHLVRRFSNLYGCQWWSPTMICWGLGAFGLGLTGILETAGYKMLNDILDLEREDIAKIPGMTPETSDQLMAFLSELTDEDSGEESRPKT